MSALKQVVDTGHHKMRDDDRDQISKPEKFELGRCKDRGAGVTKEGVREIVKQELETNQREKRSPENETRKVTRRSFFGLIGITAGVAGAKQLFNRSPSTNPSEMSKGAKAPSDDPGAWNPQNSLTENISINQAGISLRLPNHKTRMKTLEHVEVLPRETKTLVDLSGENIVTSLWMAIYGRAPLSRNGILRIYYDGSDQPGVEVDIGTLWANHLATGRGTVLGNTRHMSVEERWSHRRESSRTLQFPLPCSQGIKIDLYNPDEFRSANLYSQVTYLENITAPIRMKGGKVIYQARDRVLKSDSIYKMLDVNPGSGWLVWTSSCTQGRNDTFMESNFEVYLDNETEPSIKTSGWEDWYRSGFYYYNIPYGKPYMMCNVRNNRTHCTSVGIDLMELHGGIKFDSSIKTQLDVNESNTDFDISWSQLYYTAQS